MRKKLHGSSRERLLAAAKSLFVERGYEAATTAAVAQLARTSQSQLLKHFRDKAGLLHAVLESGWRELNAAVRLAIARIASPLDQVNLAFDMLLSYLEQDPEFRSVFLLEADRMRTPDSGAREFTGILDKSFERLAAAGSLRPNLNPRALRTALMGTVKDLLRSQLVGASQISAAESETQLRLLFSNFLSSCLLPTPVIQRAKAEPEVLEEQPWLDHYLELADALLHTPLERLPRA